MTSAATLRDRTETTEQSVLGALFLAPERLPDLALSDDDFSTADDRRVWRAMQSALAEGAPFEPLALSHLAGADLLDYLTDLSGLMGSAENVTYHASLVRDASLRRKLSAIGADLQAAARSDNLKTAEIQERALAALVGAESASAASGLISGKSIIADAILATEKAQATEGDLVGLTTGLTGLDRILGGLKAPQLVIIAARPSQGKTSLVVGNLSLAALHAGARVAFFSVESSSLEIGQRLLAAESRLDLSRICNGRLSPDGWVKLVSAGEALDAFGDRFWIDDSADTLPAMHASLRRATLKAPVDLIAVDYLQLIRTPGGRVETRNIEVAEFTRGLKAMAKQYDAPVVCLSQFSRAIESRGGEPRLSDLRDSGAIEQDADVVLMPHDGGDGDQKILVRKNRNGPCGSVPVVFQKAICRFYDRAGGGGNA